MGDYTMPIKIAGQSVEPGLPEDLIVLRPQTDSEIIIRARAFADFDEFHALCPIPEPPGRQERGRGWVPNLEDKTYKQRLQQHGLQRVGWMVLQSLHEVEFETVQSDNPKSWPKWEDELKEAGFTQVECNLMLALVLDVNGLNEAKMSMARESFLHGQGADQNALSSPISEQPSMPSGEAASDSE
jgi:hypothetical protein